MEFPDSIVSEDLPFVIANLCAAKSIRFINRELYTYHLDASSMSRIADERRLQSLWALKTCEDWLGKRHLDPNVLASYHVCKVHHLHLNCGLATDQSRDILLKYMNNYLKSLDDEMFGRLMQHPFLRSDLRQYLLQQHVPQIQNSHSSRAHSDRLRVIYAGLMLGVSALSIIHSTPCIADDFYILGGGGGGGGDDGYGGYGGHIGDTPNTNNKGGNGGYSSGPAGGGGGGAFVGSDLSNARSGNPGDSDGEGGDGYCYNSKNDNFKGKDKNDSKGGDGGSVGDNNPKFSLSAGSLSSLDNLYVGGGDGGNGGASGSGGSGGDIFLDINSDDIDINDAFYVTSGKGGNGGASGSGGSGGNISLNINSENIDINDAFFVTGGNGGHRDNGGNGGSSSDSDGGKVTLNVTDNINTNGYDVKIESGSGDGGKGGDIDAFFKILDKVGAITIESSNGGDYNVGNGRGKSGDITLRCSDIDAEAFSITGGTGGEFNYGDGSGKSGDITLTCGDIDTIDKLL